MNLNKNLEVETPLSAEKLRKFDAKDTNDLILKLNDDGIQRVEDFVYHGEWKFAVSPFIPAV